MRTLAFTDLEMEMLSAAVRAFAEDLTRYGSWVNDRPMLPAQSLAVDMIEAETLRYRQLQLKLYDAVIKPKAG